MNLPAHYNVIAGFTAAILTPRVALVHVNLSVSILIAFLLSFKSPWHLHNSWNIAALLFVAFNVICGKTWPPTLPPLLLSIKSKSPFYEFVPAPNILTFLIDAKHWCNFHYLLLIRTLDIEAIIFSTSSPKSIN